MRYYNEYEDEKRIFFVNLIEERMKQNNRKYGKVFGVTINGTQEKEVLRKINVSLKKRTKLFITTPNPEILLASRSIARLSDALNVSDVRVCDGTGLKLALMLKGCNSERIRGRELMIKLFEIANSQKLKVYLLGATDDVIESSINRLNDEYPNVLVRGSSGPVLSFRSRLSYSNSLEGSRRAGSAVNSAFDNLFPIDKANREIESEVVQKIKKFRPDILIVAFGAPKQEIWISKYKKQLPVYIFMGVGGSLDYYSGEKNVPPKCLPNMGLEWLWRVVHEPKRIGRIFRAVIVFPVLVVKDIVIPKN